MKRFILFLLTLAMLLTLAACGQKDTVTIFVPDTTTSSNSDGTVFNTVHTVFESGWESKDSFTAEVTVLTNGTETKQIVTYGDKMTVTEYTNSPLLRVEATYNEQGQSIKTVFYQAGASEIERQESFTTYDDQGRIVSTKSYFYSFDGTQTEGSALTYTYEDTAEGSKGTAVEYNTTYILQYNKDNRIVQNIAIRDGVEISRIEFSYDEYGNQIGSTSYSNGEIYSVNEMTFRAVKVPAEVAERLPQFNRKN